MELVIEIHSSVISTVGSNHWPVELWLIGLGSQFKIPLDLNNFGYNIQSWVRKLGLDGKSIVKERAKACTNSNIS